MQPVISIKYFQKLIIVLTLPPATLVQGQINSTGGSGAPSDLNLSD